jgi:hypothetical protein
LVVDLYSAQNALNDLNQSASEKVATLLFLPSGTVSLHFHWFQNNVTLSSSVSLPVPAVKFSILLGLRPMLRAEQSDVTLRYVERLWDHKFVMFALIIVPPPCNGSNLYVCCSRSSKSLNDPVAFLRSGPPKSSIRCDMHFGASVINTHR